MESKLDKLDRQILELIRNDARIPFLEVARECGVSGAAIHQRVNKLTELGIIKGAQYVIDPAKVGYETCAFVMLYLQDPSRSNEVLEVIEKIPEIVECHQTTGHFDIFMKVYARNNMHLHEIIRDRLQPLGLARTETIICFNNIVDRALPIENFNEEPE